MICRICGVNETDNPDRICDRCYKLQTGIFSVELAAPYIIAKSWSSSKISYKAKDTSSRFRVSDFNSSLNYRRNIMNSLSTEKQKKRRKIVSTRIIYPLCYGNYEGPDYCKHCMINEKCKNKKGR